MFCWGFFFRLWLHRETWRDDEMLVTAGRVDVRGAFLEPNNCNCAKEIFQEPKCFHAAIIHSQCQMLLFCFAWFDSCFCQRFLILQSNKMNKMFQQNTFSTSCRFVSLGTKTFPCLSSPKMDQTNSVPRNNSDNYL